MEKQTAAIAGGGLVGSMLALYLARAGYQVEVFERRPDMRTTQGYQGRSINLALSDRGWLSLKELGLEERIREIALPMQGRMLHQPDGTVTFQPYGKGEQAIYSVSRSAINMALMDAAEAHTSVTFHFEHRCEAVQFDERRVRFSGPDGSTQTRNPNLMFGADGAFSATRLSKQLGSDLFQYQQYYIDCGYKELHIPAGPNGTFLLDPNALHIWPRGKFMMIALPNPGGDFTCTLFFPFEGPSGFNTLSTPEVVMPFFEEHFADAVPLMPTLLEDFFRNPTSSLVTVKCFPWVYQDWFGLIGDAAHAIVPFFGQGMNCGFEDCRVLSGLISDHQHNWGAIMPAYEALRKPDGDAIADLAIQNFEEMSNRVADPRFLLQKKIEAWFHDRHPDSWIPAYTQVAFSPNIRYSEALANGRRQEAIMQEVLALPGIEQNWQTEAVEQLMRERIEV